MKKKVFVSFIMMMLVVSTILPNFSFVFADNQSNEPAVSVQPMETSIEIEGETGEGESFSIFSDDEYTSSVARDYNQLASIPLKNTSIDGVEFTLAVDGVSDDLAINFIEEGSKEHPYVLLPNEEKDAVLGIHTQDAKKHEYEFRVLALDHSNKVIDEATVFLHVTYENINFTIEEVGEDPNTLEKKVKITNLGDKVTDISLSAEDSILPYISFFPEVNNAVLEKNESIEVIVKPSLKDIKEQRR